MSGSLFFRRAPKTPKVESFECLRHALYQDVGDGS